MKIYFYALSLLFLLFGSTSLYSQQSFERTFPDHFYHNPLHASFMGDSILVVGDYGKSDCGAKYISLLDEKGYPIWDSTAVTGTTGALTHSLIHNDTIYAIGFVELDDLLIDACFLSPALFRFNKNGALINQFVIDTTVLNELNIPDSNIHSGNAPLKIILIDNKIYFNYANGFISLKTDLTNPTLTTFPNLTHFRDWLYLADERIVALSIQGLHFFDKNFNFIESVPIEPEFEELGLGYKIDYFHNHILINEPHSITTVNLDDVSISRVGEGRTFNHQFTTANDTLYIYGDFALLGGVSALTKMDTTFTFVEDSRTASSPDLRFNDMIIQDGQMVFLGRQRVERFTQSREELHGGFVWSTRDFTFLENRNVAISNLQVIEPLKVVNTYYEMISFTDSILIYDVGNNNAVFQFDISNIGTEKIDTLAIASQQVIRFFGFDIRKTKTYTDLDLQPNETITLTEEYDPFFTRLRSPTLTFDIFVFHPDHKFDHDLDNNIISNVNIFTNTTDITIPATAIDCYPNPTQNVINIEFSDDLKLQQWELYQVDGKLIRTGDINSSSFQLTRNGLAVGVYFLKLRGELGSAVKQIVFKD